MADASLTSGQHRGLLSVARGRLVLLALVVLAVVVAGVKLVGGSSYEVKFLLPEADKTFVGAKVMIGGQTVGRIEKLGVRDGMAEVTASVDDAHAPLPAGTEARIKWLSILGARVLEILPGEKKNAALPSGHLVTSNVEGAELADLLNMLDAPTRAKLQKLLASLDGTLSGKAKNLNTTLRESGPTFLALGQVLRAVGEDGPAIKQLVSQLHGVTSTVAARDGHLSQTVRNLDALTRAVAAEQSQLRETLQRLPGTIGTATDTLNAVPEPVGSARQLLRQVRPAAARLPGIARNLQPALAAAKPAVADLTPLLQDADALLQETPALAAGARDLLPTADQALERANPMVSFLRPYTPELAGWLSNWVGIFGSRNGSGNYARALITASASSLDDVLPGVPPGMAQNPRPEPGSLVGWTDANGDTIQ